MKSKKKKLSALIVAIAVLTVSTVSVSGSAVTTVRDPDGDGRILMSDGSFILQYLVGGFNPTSQKSLDFDGNGIVSNKDATVLAHYWMQLINGSSVDDSNLPAPVGADTQAVATTRTYMRHYYNSNNPASCSEYTLTVDPLDNTSRSSNYATPRALVSDNDMIRDYDTAVVNLSVGGTGFIVDDHIIATAAHCVFSYQTKEFSDNQIRIVDEDNNVTVITPKYTDISKIYYSNSTYTTKYDYALIYVKEDLSKYGKLQLGVALDDYIDGHGEVIVSGFPSNSAYPPSYMGQPYGIRFKAKGKITSSNNERIGYDADTASGDSGGPVYVEECFSTNRGELYDYRTVIAINTTISYYEGFGIPMDIDMLKFYLSNSNIEY